MTMVRVLRRQQDGLHSDGLRANDPAACSKSILGVRKAKEGNSRREASLHSSKQAS